MIMLSEDFLSTGSLHPYLIPMTKSWSWGTFSCSDRQCLKAWSAAGDEWRTQQKQIESSGRLYYVVTIFIVEITIWVDRMSKVRPHVYKQAALPIMALCPLNDFIMMKNIQHTKLETHGMVSIALWSPCKWRSLSYAGNVSIVWTLTHDPRM